MLKQHIKFFFRNIRTQKGSFLINTIGLASGLACVLLIFLWVKDELSIDNFHEKGDHLVRIMQSIPTPNGIETDDVTQGPLAQALADEFPEVHQTVAVIDRSWFEGEKFLLSNGAGSYFSADNLFAGKNYFSMFSFPLLHGSPHEVLSSTNGVVISEGMAKKLFGTTNAMGKTVEWVHDEFGGSYTVSGVFKTLPKNTTEHFDAVFNIEIFIAQNEDLREWNNSDVKTFALLDPNTSLEAFNMKIKDFLKSKSKNFPETYLAQRYSESYLYSNFENGRVSGGRIQYVTLFSIIALLILVIACMNFINMATARASTRIKEIGVKKTVGAKRESLTVQFTLESIATATIAMAVALVFVLLLLPQFNAISGKQLTLTPNSELVSGILLITFFTGLSAGIYPALYLSKLSALRGLKGKLEENGSGYFIRKGLVVFQFTISIVLIAAVVVVYKQMDFVQHKNLGFKKEQVIWFSAGVLDSNLSESNTNSGLSEAQIESFLQILKNTPGVINASNFRHTMMADFGTTTGLDWPEKSERLDAQFAQISGGYDFIETMQIQLKEGRLFSRNYQNEKEKIIFNEAAIKQMGLKNPIGKVISLWGEDKEIIGVVKDFHIDKLYNEVMPVFMKLDNDNFASNIMVRIHPDARPTTLARIEKAYKSYFISEMPFEYRFLDDNYQSLYEGEKRVARLSKYFAGLAILISCLGLFGLAVFTAQRRSKEIGIRKVLGQTMSQVTLMLTVDFIKLVLVAIIIALPLAYALANYWLSEFAYRISLNMWYFISAGLSALVIALLTVGSQAVKAASQNPVNTLKQE